MDVLRGSCLCGAVRFEAELPTIFLCHCHCHWCRVAHGAAFVTWTGVKAEQLRQLGDQPVWYRSSTRSERGGCGTCGCRLFYRSTSSPGEVHIAAASVTEGIDRKPSAHIFIDEKVPWLEIADGLPQIPGTDPRLGRYAGDPTRA